MAQYQPPKQEPDVYGEPIIIKEGHFTSYVYRPILTDEERERRMKIIHDAAARLLISCGY